jgi:glucosylceramidase
MKANLYIAAAFAAGALSLSAKPQTAQSWATRADRSLLLTESDAPLVFKKGQPAGAVIDVDPRKTFQTIDGFGFALTGGSAQWIVRMTPAARQALLEELFASPAGLGISYLRVSIGSSDLNARTFSYDDLPAGETDEEMKRFDLSDDKANVIPVLKEILQINPKIKILGSPWSAPTWMKTNGNIQGGKLKPEYYTAYALYFLKYIQAMQANGIAIDTLTVQNEPFNDGNTPSMQFFAKEEARFIRDYLGPLFEKNHMATKIVVYDHNCDAPEYPISILNDKDAARYVDGSGFHLYAGPITALTKVHNAFPKKNLYFTEMMVTDLHGFNTAEPLARIVLGAVNNWSRNVILWNLGSDSKFEPHTNNGGCPFCEGAIVIEGDKVTRTAAYYTIGQVSKFVPAGSVRIGSTQPIPNTAFKTPEGKIVVVVANPQTTEQAVSVRLHGEFVQTQLAPLEAITFRW